MVERGTLRAAHGRRTRSADIAARVEADGDPAAGDHARRRRWPALRDDDRLAGAAPAARRGAWRSRARARRRAGWRRGSRELGAEVVETPAIRIEPRPVEGELRAAHRRIGEYALVCLTSPNGVRLLFEALPRPAATRARSPAPRSRRSARAPPPSSRGTASAPTSCPERFVAEALVEALAPVEVEGRRVLVARAAEARAVLPDALRERGAEVDVRRAVRDRRRAARRRRARGARARHLRDLHLQLDRALPARVGRRGRRPARGSSR